MERPLAVKLVCGLMSLVLAARIGDLLFGTGFYVAKGGAPLYIEMLAIVMQGALGYSIWLGQRWARVCLMGVYFILLMPIFMLFLFMPFSASLNEFDKFAFVLVFTLPLIMIIPLYTGESNKWFNKKNIVSRYSVIM